MKKPSKAEAFDIVQDLKGAVSSLHIELVERLELYFAPPVPKVPRDGWDWAAKVVADASDKREYLRYVNVTADGDAIGCDGARVHIARGAAVGMAPGLYHPTTRQPVTGVGGTYPDTSRVIASGTGDAIESAEKIVRSVTDKTHGAVYVVNGSAEVSARYLDEALAGDAPDCARHWPDKQGGKYQGINRFGQYVVMGMRPQK